MSHVLFSTFTLLLSSCTYISSQTSGKSKSRKALLRRSKYSQIPATSLETKLNPVELDTPHTISRLKGNHVGAFLHAE
jgi:hypothetical protein